MHIYFVIMAVCLVGPVYSSEVDAFLRMTTKATTILCEPDSIVVTPTSTDCEGKQSCSLPKDTSFFCLRKEFQKENCKELTKDTIIDPNGCYVSNEDDKFELRYPADATKFFHVYVLRTSIEFPSPTAIMENHPAFYHYICCRICNYDCNNVKVSGKSWILTVASGNKEENFDEFFTLMPQVAKKTTLDVERFFGVANGMGIIICGDDSVIITDEPHPCAGLAICLNSFKNIVFSCLKSDFKESKCSELTRKTPISQSGCYVGKEENKFLIPFSDSSASVFHVFVLRKSLEYKNADGQFTNGPAFHYSRCIYPCDLKLDGDAWILVKASRQVEEDFGEFFVVPRHVSM